MSFTLDKLLRIEWVVEDPHLLGKNGVNVIMYCHGGKTHMTTCLFMDQNQDNRVSYGHLAVSSRVV